MRKLTSSTPVLKPVSIYNTKTGEHVTPGELQEKLRALTTLVQSHAQVILDEKLHQLITDCATYQKISPAEYARQKGYNPDLSLFPNEVKAKSRVQKLVGYSLISTIAAYVANSNPRKQNPRIGAVLNLGAVDKQMASLSYETGILALLFKCYDTEYLIEFTVPEFILKRTILKWCLPTVSVHKGEYVFRFPYQEEVPEQKKTTLKAGLDLGRAVPYTIAVLNEKNQRVAHYTSSKRLNLINRKRDRLLQEKSFILKKLDAYTKLGLDTSVLKTEAGRKRAKITRLGAVLEQNIGGEVARKLAKHKLNTLNVENLKWVTGSKYGSKWNHSRQQASIEHALLRKGVRTKHVNPKNTSQACSGCGGGITHDPKNRTVWCAECKTRLDRDYNAAVNIAKDVNNNKNAYPSSRGGTGIVEGQTDQTMVATPSSLTRIEESPTFHS